MRRIDLVGIISLIVLVLTSCHPDIASLRKEVDPEYLNTIISEYEITSEYFDSDRYDGFYLDHMDEDEEGSKTSHSIDIDILYGFTKNEEPLMLLIPESIKDPIIEITNVFFPTKHDLESIVSIYNENTDSDLIRAQENIYSNDIVLEDVWMRFLYIEHVNNPNTTYPSNPEWNLFKDWLTSEYVMNIGYYYTGYSTYYHVYIGVSGDNLIFIKSDNNSAEILLELPIREISTYINDTVDDENDKVTYSLVSCGRLSDVSYAQFEECRSIDQLDLYIYLDYTIQESYILSEMDRLGSTDQATRLQIIKDYFTTINTNFVNEYLTEYELLYLGVYTSTLIINISDYSFGEIEEITDALQEIELVGSLSVTESPPLTSS